MNTIIGWLFALVCASEGECVPNEWSYDHTHLYLEPGPHGQ